MSPEEKEVRNVAETVAVEDRGDNASVLCGYSARFNSPTVIWGMFTESIKPGAFKPVLDRGVDARALYNHDANNVLGRTKSGTLMLREDANGLYMETKMPNTQLGRDVTELVKRGDVSGQSFAFTIKREEWRFASKEGEMDHREIIEIKDLYEVSVCTFPAYPDTSVGVRQSSKDGYLQARAAYEEAKRRTGNSGGKVVRDFRDGGYTLEVVLDEPLVDEGSEGGAEEVVEEPGEVLTVSSVGHCPIVASKKVLALKAKMSA